MDQQDSIDARNRLGAGRIIAKNLQPYFARGLDSMEIIEKPGTGRITVDKFWRLYYDPVYCLSLTAKELSSEWLHNINHLFRGHPERFENLDGVDKSRSDFNFAADAIINSELLKEGVTMPNPHKKAYLEQGYDMGWKPGMPVEQLYWLSLNAKSSQTDSEGLEKDEGTIPQEDENSQPDARAEPRSDTSDDSDATQESTDGGDADSEKSSEVNEDDNTSSGEDESSSGENEKSDNSDSSDGEGESSSSSDEQDDDSDTNSGDSDTKGNSSDNPTDEDEESDSNSNSEKSESSNDNSASGKDSAESGGEGSPGTSDDKQSQLSDDKSSDNEDSSNDSSENSSSNSDNDSPDSQTNEPNEQEGAGLSENPIEREYIPYSDYDDEDSSGNEAESDEHDCGSGAGGDPRPWEDEPDEKAMDLTNAEILKNDIAKDMINHEKSNPGSIPGGLLRDARVVLEPEYDWIQEFMNLIRKEIGASYEKIDHTYSRMSKKQSSQNTIILPGWQSPDPFEVAAIIDTSGSMGEKTDIALALGLLNDLLKTFGRDTQRQGLHLVSCDAGATASFAKDLESVQLHGGGGTDMRVGIQTASEIKPMVDVIITITDGGTPWPKEIPSKNRKAKYITIIVGGGATSSIPHWMHVIELKIPRSRSQFKPYSG